jgi:large subunit ribosomal protein L24
MKRFSESWKSSKKPKKQRKYRLMAPLHVRQRMVRAPLSPVLRTKYGCRAFGLRVGDKVKVMRGRFKGKEGAIKQVILAKLKASVHGMEITKNDGTKVFPLIDPSNLQIIELKLDDKVRQKVLAKKNGKKTP